MMELVLSDAVRALRGGQCQEALERYIQAAIRWPSCKDTIKPHLLEALSKVLDEMLRAQGPSSPLFRRLVHSVHTLYSTDPLVAAVLGTKCLNEGALKEAGLYLNASLTLDPYCLLARENMATLNQQLVHRWHFKMLNDLTRNSTYFRAINSTVRTIPQCTVLDIGSGTGLLSMMAVRSGAECVYACELNETFATMSCDIISTNGMEGQVSVINRPSTSITIPHTLSKRVSLVVTETVDAGLLGEWIIPSLRHAWAELLLPRQQRAPTNQREAGGHVIPCGATVYVTLIECPEIRKQTRLLCSCVGGVGVESVRLEGSCCASSLSGRPRRGYRPNSHTPLQLVREPYSCERLTSIRGGYRELSHTTTALHFDFTHPKIPLPSSRHVSLPITAEGIGDALAIWFTLNLDHTHSINTAPSGDTSWDQAVFPLATPICVRDGGDPVRVCASCTDISLEMSVESTAESTNGMEPLVCFVERGDVLRLNDAAYMSSYQRAIASAVRSVLQECVMCEASEGAQCVVLDVSQGFSLFGLMAALEGADFVMLSQLPLMYHSAVKEIIHSNGLTEQVSVRYRNGAELVRTGVVWDVVVCDLVSPQGTLHTGILEELEALCSSSHSPLFLPSSISLCTVLISSPALRACSSVLGTLPTLGFDVACSMNHYQVSHYTDLDLTSVLYTRLSDDTHVCTLTSGKAPCNMDHMLRVRVTEDGTLTGIVYWFRMHLHGDITVDTGPTCNSGHWHHSVFLLSEDVPVSYGEEVKVHAVVRNSCVWFELNNPLSSETLIAS